MHVLMLLICAKVVYLKLNPFIYFIQALTAWLKKISTAYLEEQTSSQARQVPDTDSPFRRGTTEKRFQSEKVFLFEITMSKLPSHVYKYIGVSQKDKGETV